MEILKTIDETIKAVCEKVQTESFTTEEYVNTVKALAMLVEARATVNPQQHANRL